MSEKQSWLNFRVAKPEPTAAETEQRGRDERRQQQKSFDGDDRRHGGDRRGMRFGLRFTTTRRLTELEDWLDINCRAGYHLAIEDMSETLDRKTVRIMFGSDEERQDFRQTFGSKPGG